MVVVGIAVVNFVVDTGYTERYSKTVMPYETAAQDETEAQLGTTLVPVQSLFSPQSSLDMHLPFSLSEVGRPYNPFHHGLQIYKIYNTN